MYSTVYSAVMDGMKAEIIRVEADVSNGLPMFHMIGYLSSEVKEAGERVRTAIRNIGIRLQPKKMVINLSPATLRKRGSSFDLPIAVALLSAYELIRSDTLEKVLFLGELGLNGEVIPVSGVLPMVIEAREKGYKTCVVPKGNEKEGCIIQGIQLIGINHLTEVLDYIKKPETFQNAGQELPDTMILPIRQEDSDMDFQDIRGQEILKRAAEISVAGQHNLLMVGTPGAGKTMVAKRIPTILPPLNLEESIEISKVYSVLGMLDQKQPLIRQRPFRQVHHTVTKTALIGGGTYPAPGEISLAHGGVLFVCETLCTAN